MLAVMLAQALVLSQLTLGTRAYAVVWIVFEPAVFALEIASVFELLSHLLKGRLNATLGSLRSFLMLVLAVALLLAAVPLWMDPHAGRGLAAQLVLRARGFGSLGLLIFFAVLAWILARQPVRLNPGLVRHSCCFTAYLTVLALAMYSTSWVPTSLTPFIQTAEFALLSFVFALWAALLWNADFNSGNVEIDPLQAASAEGAYKEFRQNVRSLKP
jgi:hypothetical protein